MAPLANQVDEDRRLFRQGLIDGRDYNSYRELYQVLTVFLPPPDLVVYLRASVPTFIERIKSRGRDYERQIEPEYLWQLNELYEEWTARFQLCPVLMVPADDLDYVSNPGHLDLIVRKVQEKRYDVRERFMKGQYIYVGRLRETRMQTID